MTDRLMTTKQVRNLYRFAYAWRSEDDLAAGDTDLSRNRELQAAEFDRWLRQVEAAAAADAVEGAIHMVDDSDSAERLAKLADQWREECQ